MTRWLYVALTATISPAAYAIVPLNPPSVSIPALDTWGMVGLGVVLGLTAYIIRFRRK